MEEMEPNYVQGTGNIKDFCGKMYFKVDKKHPMTGLFNGVRIIMFQEE